ncbi:MAG: hypothetical protein C3L24_00330, partial [Candidatus Sedimenticola endophacoides]
MCVTLPEHRRQPAAHRNHTWFMETARHYTVHMSFSFPGPSRQTRQQDHAISLEREGQAWLNRLTGAARDEPWPVTLLKLAWTAGPATLAAAWLGYYMGFGQTAPLENLRFFFAYTVVFGVIGLATGILARATYGQRRRLMERDLLRVADHLPDLIATVRDLHLAALEPEVRRLEAVGLLLQRVDLSPEALALAIEELGAGRRLARIAAKIELYRLSGLNSRVQELANAAATPAQTVVAAVAEWAPTVATLLERRLAGDAPSYSDGIARDSNFLERILTAMGQEDDRLMTLLDAEEVLVLACELINGRRIPMLLVSYRGHWGLARATDRLEQRRNLYRIANNTVLSRLKALVALLGESGTPGTVGATRGLDSAMLLSQARDGIAGLNRSVDTLGSQPAPLTGDARQRLQDTLETLQAALRLTEDMRRAVHRAARRHTLFQRTAEKWHRDMQRIGDLEMDRPDSGRRGLQVVERHIQLNDEQCLSLAVALAGIFRERGLESRGDRLYCLRSGQRRLIDTEQAKSLAMEVTGALQPYVDITRPEVQRAIDASPAANLLGLDSNLSARTKATWGNAAVQEMADDLSSAALRLAATLVTNYRVTLSDAAIEFLQRRYGAPAGELQQINRDGAARPALSIQPRPTRPPLV